MFISPAREAIIMIEPAFLLFIPPKTMLMSIIGPFTFTSIIFHQSSNGVYSKGRDPPTPALGMTTSSGPRTRSVSSTAACTATASTASTAKTRHLRPNLDVMISATSSSWDFVRARMERSAPASAKATAIALPIPRPKECLCQFLVTIRSIYRRYLLL